MNPFRTVGGRAAARVAAVEQRLAGGDVSVANAIQAHLLLHRFDLIAGGIDEVPPAGQFGAIDLELVRILLHNRCTDERGGFCAVKEECVHVLFPFYFAFYFLYT